VNRDDVVFSARALESLRQVTRYIAEEAGPGRATDWLTTVTDSTVTLETHPYAFPFVGKFEGERIRARSIMRHVLYYFVDESVGCRTVRRRDSPKKVRHCRTNSLKLGLRARGARPARPRGRNPQHRCEVPAAASISETASRNSASPSLGPLHVSLGPPSDSSSAGPLLGTMRSRYAERPLNGPRYIPVTRSLTPIGATPTMTPDSRNVLWKRS